MRTLFSPGIARSDSHSSCIAMVSSMPLSSWIAVLRVAERVRVATESQLALLLLLAFAGCSWSGGGLRPDGTPWPEECPPEALKAMRLLTLRAEKPPAKVTLDINQSGDPPIRLYDGRVESYLNERLGMLSELTRLYGKVWTD